MVLILTTIQTASPAPPSFTNTRLEDMYAVVWWMVERPADRPLPAGEARASILQMAQTLVVAGRPVMSAIDEALAKHEQRVGTGVWTCVTAGGMKMT